MGCHRCSRHRKESSRCCIGAWKLWNRILPKPFTDPADLKCFVLSGLRMEMRNEQIVFYQMINPCTDRIFRFRYRGVVLGSAVCKMVYLYLPACLRIPVMKAFTGSASANGMPSVGERYSVYSFSLYTNFLYFVVSFRRTSCAPPSTMETEETNVSFAFSRSSGRVSAPQLHMVERIFDKVTATPSANAPA